MGGAPEMVALEVSHGGDQLGGHDRRTRVNCRRVLLFSCRGSSSSVPISVLLLAPKHLFSVKVH